MRIIQSRRMSLIEAIANVGVGYSLAVAVQIVVLPWFGMYPSLGENMAIGAVFTGTSLTRGYALRSLFERCFQEVKSSGAALLSFAPCSP